MEPSGRQLLLELSFTATALSPFSTTSPLDIHNASGNAHLHDIIVIITMRLANKHRLACSGVTKRNNIAAREPGAAAEGGAASASVQPRPIREQLHAHHGAPLPSTMKGAGKYISPFRPLLISRRCTYLALASGLNWRTSLHLTRLTTDVSIQYSLDSSTGLLHCFDRMCKRSTRCT